MLNALDLFTGLGGITIALSDWVRPVAYCEIDKYCQSVLLQRMQEGNLPKAPIWDDIRMLPSKELPRVDIIYGGFPCQDISIAGHGIGLEGKRSGLFFEILRIAEAIHPFFIFLENVPNIRTKGAERVGKELAERGYDCRWCMLSASDVGAKHKRERWFLLAHANNKRDGGWPDAAGYELPSKPTKLQQQDGKAYTDNAATVCADVANATSLRCHKRPSEGIQSEGKAGEHEKPCDISNKVFGKEYWAVEPDVGRVVNGLPNRVDRIKALGNSVVPLQVKAAFEILLYGNSYELLPKQLKLLSASRQV
jgi:DNA (cytosine-5)-methyltransferase 1